MHNLNKLFIVNLTLFFIGLNLYPYGTQSLPLIDIHRHHVPEVMDSLIVGSYNILFEYPDRIPKEEDRQWENRKVQLHNIFEKVHFDVVGLQESRSFQLEEIGKWKDYGYIEAGTSVGGFESNQAIVYRKSRLQLLNYGDFWFSDTPDVPGSHSWDSPCCARMCTWAKFKDVKTEKIFYVFNSHFDHAGIDSRFKSAQLLLSKAKDIAIDSEHVILTGDFNAEVNSDPIQIILKDGRYRDSREGSVSVPRGPYGTFHGFDLATPKYRIDYVFVSKDITVNSYRVVDEELRSQAWASDHLPVVTSLLLK